MTEIYGLMIMRNEADRYLEKCLTYANTFLDHIYIMDDQSDDDSVNIAAACGATIIVRDDECPSFMDDEAALRGATWEWFYEEVGPGSWALAFDADEFLYTKSGNKLEPVLHDSIELAVAAGCVSVDIPFEELWGSPEKKRVDGAWDVNSHPRLFKVREEEWCSGGMGLGSQPSYAKSNVMVGADLKMLHAGYLREEDIQAKYERYSKVRGAHTSAHIKSIIQKPTLVGVEALPRCLLE